MRFHRFEVPGLAQISYLVGCARDGRAAVIDPKRDVDTYLEFAALHDLSIDYVLETHIHADFASGARELAAAAGAELCLSAYDAGERYEVAFPHRKLEDGERLELGSVVLAALHTPGHTPEHLAYLVSEEGEEAPCMLLSGDFLFVGSVGRPDLLGEEATRGLAERLFESLRRVVDGLPDSVEIHPGHGAGSLCGAGLSDRAFSNLGQERHSNPYLDPALDRERFVERLLANLPPLPPYYPLMKELNARGPAAFAGRPPLEPLPPDAVRDRIGAGAVAVDLRPELAFGAGHLPASFSIGAGASLSTWAAWVVPYDRPILLVTDRPEDLEGAVRSLARVGLDRVEGFLEGGVEAWRAAGYPTTETPQMTPAELADAVARSTLRVLDVRTEAEWAAGHIEGAMHVHCGLLPDRVGELAPRTSALAVVCEGGYRSTLAASLLEREGVPGAVNVAGGMVAWRRAGLPVTVSPGVAAC